MKKFFKYLIALLFIVAIILLVIFIPKLDIKSKEKIKEKDITLTLDDEVVKNLYEKITNCNQNKSFSLNNFNNRNPFFLKEKEIKDEDVPNTEKFLCSITRLNKDEFEIFRKDQYDQIEFKASIDKKRIEDLALDLFKTYENENYELDLLVSKDYFSTFYVKTIGDTYLLETYEAGLGFIPPPFYDFYTRFDKAIKRKNKLYIKEKYITFEQENVLNDKGEVENTDLYKVKVYDSYLDDKRLIEDFEVDQSSKDFKKDELLDKFFEKARTITYEFEKINDKYVFIKSSIN